MATETILIIGGTGAQGIPIVKELLQDGKYKVRALTRDAESHRAKQIQSFGAELVQGDLTKIEDLQLAFKGVDYCFVNLDTFAMGEKAELYHAIRIFEVARQTKTVKHYIWSTLPYILKTHGEKYNAAHYSTKGRVADFIAGQPGGNPEYSGMKYSFFSTCPYMDTLSETIAPKKEGDKYIFAYPLGAGRLPLIALEDTGKYVRYMFDHLDQFIGKTLEASSDTVTLEQLAETFTRVTGKPAESRNITTDEFFKGISDSRPLSLDEPEGLTYKGSFSCWWNIYRDELKDYAYLDTILPERLTLETWMRKTNYTGDNKPILKLLEGGTWILGKKNNN